MVDNKTHGHLVYIPLDGAVALQGGLFIPPHPRGMVVFAHGSGSSRFSIRNQSVSQALNRAGFATLLFDLLTADEEANDRYTRHLRFDIGLLAQRVTVAIDWLRARADTRGLPIGLFGASTGAAAALVAAANRPGAVDAVVSRGGRPDLAGYSLHNVHASTLLIVGERDTEVLELNRMAFAELAGVKDLAIVPGATHLFEEPGTLEEAARLAADWFTRHLPMSAEDKRQEAGLIFIHP